MSRKWTKHRDETYKTDYWYNEATGESSWTEPAGASAVAATEPTGERVELSGAQEVDGEAEEGDALLTSAALSAHTSPPSPRKGVRSSDVARVSLLLHTDRVYADTAAAIATYERSMYWTALLIEGPLCVLEAALRGTCFLCVAVGCGVFAVGTLCFTPAPTPTPTPTHVPTPTPTHAPPRASGAASCSSVASTKARRHYMIIAVACIREAVLCAACMLTLLIPGTACLVYR